MRSCLSSSVPGSVSPTIDTTVRFEPGSLCSEMEMDSLPPLSDRLVVRGSSCSTGRVYRSYVRFHAVPTPVQMVRMGSPVGTDQRLHTGVPLYASRNQPLGMEHPSFNDNGSLSSLWSRR